MKILTLLVLAATGSWSFEGAAAVRAALSGIKPLTILSIKQADKPEAKVAGQKLIRLSGYLTLNGSGYSSGHSPFATVTVNGWTTLRDQDGRTLNGQIHFTDTNTYHASGGGHVSGTAYPRAYVSIYRNGKYVGSVTVSGTIYVSGWKNGDWVNLSGSGYVDGSGYITEEDPKP
jgi:hypothetical protein